MSVPKPGAIDCDLHVVVPGNDVLLPYLSDYWREQVVSRGLDLLELSSYPRRNPLAGRDDWRDDKGRPGASLDRLRSDVLDRFGLRMAVCNVVYGGQAVFNADFGIAVCSAVNDWVRAAWLDAEPRLRASIVVPMQDPEAAVAEIERMAGDRRFVQVLMLSTGDAPLGQRRYWPIYAAAVRHGLPVMLHPGAAHRFAPSYVGWPSYFIEDYALQSQTLQGQLLSLVYEGAFHRHPDLRIVLAESGISWLPSFLWRFDSTWRALRMEVPWLEEPPSAVVRRHVRLTAQPFDAPEGRADMAALLAQSGIGGMLMFATDYPHHQFDADAVLPPHLPGDLVEAMCVTNPLSTYPRLAEAMT